MMEKFQTLEVRGRKSSKAWKFFAVLFPMLGSLAFAQGPGSLTGFFQAWWGQSGFNPSFISGLTLWLDANDSSTLFDAASGGSASTNGGAVARWEDKSINALHYTQSNSALQPIFNGVGVDFDGSNDQLQSTNGSNAMAGKTNYSFFIVFEADSFSGSPNLIRFDSFQFSDQLFELGTMSPALTFIGRSDVASNFRTYNTSNNRSLSTSTKYLYAFDRDSDTTGLLKINSVSYTNFTGALVAVNVRTNQTATLAAYANNLYLNGRVFEVLLYGRTLSNAEYTKVADYLNAKWSIY
jgi:hypothetical protein